MLKPFFLFPLLLSSICFSQFQQLGSDIYAPNYYEKIGIKNDISFDGRSIATVLLVGSDHGTYTSIAKVYYWGLDDWLQKGETFIPASENERIFEANLSLNGTRLAIGALVENGSGSEDLYISRVYDWNDGTKLWEQVGDDISVGGDGGVYEHGLAAPIISLDLSEEGSNLIVGLRENYSGPGYGMVIVFSYDGSSWYQKGSSIFGNSDTYSIGKSVSISGDGNTISMSEYNGDANLFVYEWTGTDWVIKGYPIPESQPSAFHGFAHDLSADGNVVAVGAPGEQISYSYSSPNKEGAVRIFKFQESKWIQLGQTIYGEEFYTRNGFTISMSASGNTVAIGAVSPQAPFHYGEIRLWDYDGALWVERENVLTGTQNLESLHMQSISGDGQVVVTGTTSYYTTAADGRGRIRVFSYNGEFPIVDAGTYSPEIQEVAVDETPLNMYLFPNPAAEFVNININKVDEKLELKIFDALGRLVISRSNLYGPIISIKTSQLKSGNYVIILQNDNYTDQVKLVLR
ncbi:T9SS type A sorting domain-containing protein [Crocinitomix catalasitica]|nr:T9SS type A sorting domain-containing protein [Crocinitomix catalasitica]